MSGELATGRPPTEGVQVADDAEGDRRSINRSEAENACSTRRVLDLGCRQADQDGSAVRSDRSDSQRTTELDRRPLSERTTEPREHCISFVIWQSSRCPPPSSRLRQDGKPELWEMCAHLLSAQREASDGHPVRSKQILGEWQNELSQRRGSGDESYPARMSFCMEEGWQGRGGCRSWRPTLSSSGSRPHPSRNHISRCRPY